MSIHSIDNLCIAKFGGTSMANFDAMRRSAKIVLSDRSIRLVILSASAGITDLLVKLSRGNNTEIILKCLNKIQRIQYNIINKLDHKTIIRKEINKMISNIAKLAKMASLATSLSLSDELASYGELMSSKLFVALLQQYGLQACWFDIRKIMRTNDHFGYAKPNHEILKSQTFNLLLPYLRKKVVITQGFIGSEIRGRTTTLGRGGSDYTATLLGEALKAVRIDIWTDVPGIYTTDPNVVSEAKRINEISFIEATEMAAFGAKILHPDTLLPAIRSSIPVFVGSSKEPNAGRTLISSHVKQLPLFRALVLRKHQTLLTLHNLSMLYACSFLATVFNILSQHAISVDLITTSEISIALTIDNSTFTKSNINLITPKLISDLSLLCKVQVEEHLVLVTLIGNYLPYISRIGKRIFNILSSFKIRLICYGNSSRNICLLVSSDDSEQIIKILHHALFDKFNI